MLRAQVGVKPVDPGLNANGQWTFCRKEAVTDLNQRCNELKVVFAADIAPLVTQGAVCRIVGIVLQFGIVGRFLAARTEKGQNRN